MKTLLELLQEYITQTIRSQFPDLTKEESEADVTFCAQEEFGHYQCNSALRLAKLTKLNPRAVAQKIIDALSPECKQAMATIQIAGPGFINFTFSSPFLSNELKRMFVDSHLGASIPKKKQRIVVDFSSPNVAKELHVGHLRSTIIGDCLCRLFEFLGADVLRLNHLGDWGTQFGMLIAYMKQFEHVDRSADLPTLMAWYRSAKKLFDEDPEFQKRAQLEVVALQSGNPNSRKIWELICAISSRGYDEIYKLLDVKIVSRGESFYNPFLSAIVHELEQKGLVTISGGAKCIFLEGFQNREGEPLPLMIQKSDGGYSYDTTDMAAMKHRIFTEKADRIIYVTDNGQATHFAMIFAAAKKAGWLDHNVELDHVAFGLVLGPDGKKFKTRSGDTEKLIDLLVEGIDKAREVLREKMPDASAQEIDHSAKVLGIDAIKYADLSSQRTKDYTFSYDRMLRFDGNTAFFLIYAYVRINGIKRKVHVDIDKLRKEGHFAVEHLSEISLGVHLRRFGEILQMVTKDLYPNRLAEYLYVLAEKFNAFYRDCRIEGTPEQNSRLILAELTAMVFKQGLEILGLKTVDRM